MLASVKSFLAVVFPATAGKDKEEEAEDEEEGDGSDRGTGGGTLGEHFSLSISTPSSPRFMKARWTYFGGVSCELAASKGEETRGCLASAGLAAGLDARCLRGGTGLGWKNGWIGRGVHVDPEEGFGAAFLAVDTDFVGV